ncbi:syntaphilin-like isoform X2 [Anguilla anguilla]|nr:syntaphilin-like isoform X2 [Anguilla anguilla]XP_035244226.1 syntaphilin-like isoform X2 [Anguilla anguilla]
MSAPVTQKASSGSHSFDYCRFIELDCVPMETGYMVSMRPSHGHMPHQSPERHRRRTAPPCSSRDPYGSASICSSTSGSCKGSDGSPTARSYPTTPRRNVKYTSCGDNHGIRPPPPEQYLTPLQQKEVCIRHLRARLKENMERLQDRDSEIEELRTQLSRMQEDWIEEECHRVEAQLALKDARREIQQLKQVVDVVRTNLGGREAGLGLAQQHLQDADAQSCRLDCLLRGLEDQQGGGAPPGPGGSRSWGGSPARSLTRSSTYTKLSHEALLDPAGTGLEPGLSGEETQDSGFACGDSRADLLLEALLYEGPPSPSSLDPYAPLPRSFTYEKLCTCEQAALRAEQVGQASSSSQPCLSRQQLYLHHLCERAIQTDHALPPPCHAHTKSQSCSPSSTWISEEGEDLDTVTTATAAIEGVAPPTTPPDSCTVDLPPVAQDPPQTCQPKGGGPPEEHCRVTVAEAAEEEEGVQEGAGAGAESGAEGGLEASPPQKSYWSRHFLMDLLAVAVPVVPAVAWLCRGPRRQGQPVYNIGSLLRGCCALALHSLRRVGAAGCGPVSGRGGTEI